ncbi:phage tail protein [Pedobacter metabolipauper]|uniref:Microcystin-dependent protein n=1 Tax=Pedobacter metabolipauper TaxID=425513 RepID=A0A4R6SRS3_9SPHI|nr:tail fiber protein [Pedobacter metabolipauper]TDQ08055.1 microcystin-dependent protein [Pedobacter metabolipauper]
MEAYVGEIRIFTGTFAPLNWFFCQGQELSSSVYQPLFGVLGMTYGGDPVKRTFKLPDFTGGLIPMGKGDGPNLTPRKFPDAGGSVSNKLDYHQLPGHSHLLKASTVAGTSSDPTDRIFANRANADRDYVNMIVNPTAINTKMNSDCIQPEGTADPDLISNIQPSLGLNFIICAYGNYPSPG